MTDAIDTLIPDSNWYLLKDQNQLGPYYYQELISMLLEKKSFGDKKNKALFEGVERV